MEGKLELYKIFACVARHESFSAAAKELFMSQSAVSQAIRQLEERLGTRLFLRSRKGVILSHEGQALSEYVFSALGLLRTGEEQLRSFSSLDAGELRIGAGDTISKYLLLPSLEAFHAAYPKVRLQIINRTSLETVELLKQGFVDIGLLNLPLEDRSIEQRMRIPVQDIFVAGSRFEKLYQRPISLTQLSQLPLILLEGKANSRKYIDQFFLENRIVLQPEIELGSHELLLEFSGINLGISCVVREFSQQYLQRGAVREVKLETPIPPREIGVCSLSGLSLPRPADRFLQILQENLAGEKENKNEFLK